jgi:hypothetical protein
MCEPVTSSLVVSPNQTPTRACWDVPCDLRGNNGHSADSYEVRQPVELRHSRQRVLPTPLFDQVTGQAAARMAAAASDTGQVPRIELLTPLLCSGYQTDLNMNSVLT